MVTSGVAGQGPRALHGTALVLVALALAGCAADPRSASRAGSALDLTVPAPARVVERDMPAPEVFDLSEAGLWDGRPSLGGVWVAHPDATDPERVSIRNTQTGAEVIGALFRRERENPGPRFQISSEAAAALGIVAGQPATIQVVALRLERIEPEAPVAEAPEPVAETVPAEPVAVAAAAPIEPPLETPATPDPALAAGSIAVTDLDAPAPTPRRGFLDIFRRTSAPEAAAPGIAETALAPVAAPVAPVAVAPVVPVAIGAPLAATAMLAAEGAAPGAPLADPTLIAPEASADAPRPRFSLTGLFRRSAPETESEAEPALIPLPAAAPAVAIPPVTPVRAPAPSAITPARPFVQVGIFAVEGNADRTAAQMRAAGLPADIRAGRSGERAFWRVVVGPARDAGGQADLLARTRALGFADAYTVAR